MNYKQVYLQTTETTVLVFDTATNKFIGEINPFDVFRYQGKLCGIECSGNPNKDHMIISFDNPGVKEIVLNGMVVEMLVG